ncbi:MAG: hypothetical protein ACJAV1_000943 [Paraglaciecola sp.]|jgi:hypothetical protein
MNNKMGRYSFFLRNEQIMLKQIVDISAVAL